MQPFLMKFCVITKFIKFFLMKLS